MNTTQFNGFPVKFTVLNDRIDFQCLIAELRESLRANPTLQAASRTCTRRVIDQNLVRFPQLLQPSTETFVPVRVSVSRNGHVNLEYDSTQPRPKLELAEAWSEEAEKASVGSVDA